MFEQLFTQPATIAHHHSSPYATERRQYLSLLMEDGRSRNSLRVIAELLISHAKHLPLHRAEICASDIEFSGGGMGKDQTPGQPQRMSRKKTPRRVRKRVLSCAENRPAKDGSSPPSRPLLE